jgi:hypothetical protein
MNTVKKMTIWTALIGATIGTFTFAYQGNPATVNPNPYDLERHETMMEAMESWDYETWLNLMSQVWNSNRWVMRNITSQEDFEKFVEMKDAYEAWDILSWDKLKDELWLWLRTENYEWNQNFSSRRWQWMNSSNNDRSYSKGWCMNW